MKAKWIGFVAVVCVSLLSSASAEDVNFPDANLEAVVRDALGIPAPTPITDTDMAGLVSLIVGANDISNIQGLEYGTNLTDLTLWRNDISDISPLAGLTNLWSLSLSANQISDISPVAGLTNLDNLWLYSNQISDISAVAGLTNLTTLYLNNNQISDLSPVAGLTNLDQLWLRGSQISDISGVAGLTNLSQLYLEDNQISDISAVAGMTNLYMLYLSGNQISDISAVGGLTNLSDLYLSYNQIEIMNLSSADLSSLDDFSIEGNPLTTVLLADATLSQDGFNALMQGSDDYYPSSETGIANLPGVLILDMSGVDFTEIPDVSKMYYYGGMDDLEKLLLAGATNLDGGQVVTLTGELASLNWLDVRGLWDSFDPGAQSSLNAWDALPGNILIITDPVAGDANYDDCVDGLDYIVWSSNYNTGTTWWWQGDFSGDGYVDGLDYVIWSNSYLQGSPAAPGPVPEPATLALLGLGALALIHRRRHKA